MACFSPVRFDVSLKFRALAFRRSSFDCRFLHFNGLLVVEGRLLNVRFFFVSGIYGRG